MSDDARDREYLDRLPVGTRPGFDPEGLVGWDIFPFELEGLRVRMLEPPVLPEPARGGGPGGVWDLPRR